VATNSPINDRVALHTKQAPYRTYAMSFEITRGIIPDALYWDTQDPYHYVRLQPGEQTDFLIVGGEDHKTGMADDASDRFAALAAWTERLVPEVGVETNRWSGQVMETIDYAGFIGRNPGSRHVFVVTGDSGQGLTHGVASSLINSSLILNGNAKWSEVYEPSRKTVRGGLNYVKENLTAVKNFAEYLAPGEIGSAADLKPGQGGIIRRGLSKVAAFRNEDGTLIEKSAACTHIGCHLHWNSFERCWDCPCHGSHFAGDGTALNAPAVAPLADAGSHETSAEAPREEVH
jgi:Rieske Fe-S protein